MIARLIGPDGETVKTDYAVPNPPPPCLYTAHLKPVNWANLSEPYPNSGTSYDKVEWKLAYIIPPADGGPIAIYRQDIVQYGKG